MYKFLVVVVVMCSALYLVQGAGKCHKCDAEKQCPLNVTDDASTDKCLDKDGKATEDGTCYWSSFTDADEKSKYVAGCIDPKLETDTKKGCQIFDAAGDENKLKGCATCDTDYCNSAPITTSTMFFTLVVAAIAKFLY